MRGEDFKLNSDAFEVDWRAWPHPFALMDAGAACSESADLPPVPLLAVGASDGKAPAWADAVVEPPVALDRLLGSIRAKPNAAAALVALLRMIPNLPDRDAVAAESLCLAALQGSGEHAAWLAEQASRPGALGESGRVDVERRGEVLEVVLDRQAAHNAVDVAMRDRLGEIFHAAALDDGVKCVRLSARGKAFSIGADLSEFGTTRDPATAHGIRTRTLPAWRLLKIRNKLEAHINGACVGSGLEMAAFAARLTASRRAWFQLPELSMGIIPGAGGCVSVSRRIGRQRAALMVLSGARISAGTALKWGLIDAIVDD